MRPLPLSLSVTACLAWLAVSGCGSHSCQDAVDANRACTAKLNTSAGLDLQSCNAAACANKQGFIDCVVDLRCSDVNGYILGYDDCVVKNGCP